MQQLERNGQSSWCGALAKKWASKHRRGRDRENSPSMRERGCCCPVQLRSSTASIVVAVVAAAVAVVAAVFAVVAAVVAIVAAVVADVAAAISSLSEQ